MLVECKNLHKLGISAIKVEIYSRPSSMLSTREGEEKPKRKKFVHRKKIPDMFMNEFMALKSSPKLLLQFN